MKFILEGLWGIGKTTLAKKLIKDYGYTFLEEPVLDNDKLNYSEEQLDQMYFNAHMLNIDKSLQIDNVVIERSIISNLSFIDSRNGALIDTSQFLTSEILTKIKHIDKLIYLDVSLKDYYNLQNNLNSYMRDYVSKNRKIVLNYKNNIRKYSDLILGSNKFASLKYYEDGNYLDEKELNEFIESIIPIPKS